MEIHERLQERLPETGRFQRVVLFGPETGARHLSAVLVRLPSGHEFSLHAHPVSEDCFFVLSGSGEALEPAGRLPISAPAGVWIPAGHAHGLRAGSAGMLEVGFQSPADHTAVPYSPTGDSAPRSALVTQALPGSPPPGVSHRPWAPVFPGRQGWRHLDAEYALFESSRSFTVGSEDFEWAIVVASGGIELMDPPSRRLPAFSAIRLDPGSTLTFRTAASPTLLISVKARAAAV